MLAPTHEGAWHVHAIASAILFVRRHEGLAYLCYNCLSRERTSGAQRSGCFLPVSSRICTIMIPP